MFSGIIKHTGKINKIYKKNNNCILEIYSKIKFAKSEIGTSIACSGACLTLKKHNRNLGKFYISKETLSKTTFKSSKSGICSSSLSFSQKSSVSKKAINSPDDLLIASFLASYKSVCLDA